MGKKKTVPVYDFTGDLFGEEVRIPWNDGALEKLKAERLAEECKAAAAQKRTRRASSERETESAPDGLLFADVLEAVAPVKAPAKTTPKTSDAAEAFVAPVSAPADAADMPSAPDVPQAPEVDRKVGAVEAAEPAAKAEKIEKIAKAETPVEPEDSEGDLPGDSPVAQAMTGDTEENGALTLARYASRAYLEYAMSVVKSRALPEVSDGQKPVQRRILIDMDRMGLRYENRPVKSARVVGDVLGKYHPHGDQSVYNAMVRMAQNFSLRYPLVAGEGNFGSRDGDSQAAMRYTEARLMPIAALLLDEVDKGAVDFVPNYDGNFTEPVELPAQLPFVLLNGSSGIAVGMATEIPSHNLTEVAAACTLLLEMPEATLDEVLALMPGPDFPCGGQIISSRDEIRQVYRTGRGRLRVRARYHFEELARGQWQLVVDELPPACSSKLVLDKIEQITNPKVRKDKKSLTAKQQQAKGAMLAVLERVRDESGKDVPVRLVFEPKSSRIDREEFVQTLLVQTELEANVPVNLVMLGIDGKPRQKGLLEIIAEWLDFRLKTVRRRTSARLEKVNDRIHVLEGRSIALLNLDRVIEIIRNHDEPKEALMTEFSLTARQAEDILEIRLRQLARLAAIAIERELAELTKERASLERLLSSESALKRAVAKEIDAAAKKFGDARRTVIEEAAVAAAEPAVADEPVTVVVSKKGFVRARTGHGHDGSLMSFKMGDGFLTQVECRSVDTLVVVDDKGRVYNVPVASLPGGRGDGSPLSAFIEMERGSEAVGFLAGPPDTGVLFGTSDGMGLVCTLGDLSTRMKAGRTFLKVAAGERALPPVVTTGRTHAACLSALGRILIFPLEEIRRLSAGGVGVSLMQLLASEKLVDLKAVDARGVVVTGTGRGSKPREALLAKKSFEDHLLHRARRGKLLAAAWRAERLEALPLTEGDAGSDAGAGGSSLVIEVLEEEKKLL